MFIVRSMQSFSGYWVSHTNRYNVTFQGNVYKEVATVPKQLWVGASGYRHVSFQTVLIHSRRWFKCRFSNHTLTDLIPLILFYARLTSNQVQSSAVADLCWGLSLTSSTQPLSFRPHHHISQKTMLKTNKRTTGKILKGMWKSNKGRIHGNKNKSKTGIYAWTKGCVL